MSPEVKKSGNNAKITIEVELTGSMMEMEDKIRDGLNVAGNKLTATALEQFDTDGQALTIDDVKFTAQQKTVKDYETPYGRVSVDRYIYQTSKGGKTYCPLDSEACIITNSTPDLPKSYLVNM